MKAIRRRVIFFAEAVTLAHVARPMSLASALDPETYDITIACDARYGRFVANGPWKYVDMKSMPSAEFVDALARGQPVYDFERLNDYVKDDIALIRTHKPDLIVGDFRLSLSVSARLEGIPYISITNGYWTPGYRGGYPMPSLPMTKWLPITIASAVFSLARPIAMALHCRPINKLRRRYGLPSLGNEIRRVYTDADHVLCADAYEFVKPSSPSSHCTHLGALAWSPSIPPPAWWNKLQTGRPVVYVTLGSSGPPRLLTTVLNALEPLDLTVIASSAGAPMPDRIPANAFVEDYLDGAQASKRAAVVICNGGSPTTQQALAAGVPILGLASNMDQLLNMQSLCERGAAELIRADRVDVISINATVDRLIRSSSHRESAAQIAAGMTTAIPPREIFESVATRLLSSESREIDR